MNVAASGNTRIYRFGKKTIKCETVTSLLICNLLNTVCGDSDLSYLIPSIHVDLKVLTSFS